MMGLLISCAGPVTTVTIALDGDATGQTLLLTHGDDVRMEWAMDFEAVTLELDRPDADVEEGSASWRAYVRRDDGVYTGASSDWLYWVDEPDDGEAGNFGRHAGWNVVRQSTQDPPTTVGTTLEVSLGLTPSPSASLTGAWAVAPPDRITLLPFPLPFGRTVDEHVADVVATDPWSIGASGDPPAAHLDIFRDNEGDATTGVLELPVAYTDVDGSGGRDHDDEDESWACFGGSPVVLAWVAPATTRSAAQDVQDVGTGTGWNVVRLSWGNVGGRLSADDAGAVVMDTCDLDW